LHAELLINMRIIIIIIIIMKIIIVIIITVWTCSAIRFHREI